MTSLEPAECAALHLIADEIREEVEENGHLIRRAIELHDSFDESEHPASALLRNMVRSATRRAASRASMGQDLIFGGGLDLIWPTATVYRKYRLKRATVAADQSFIFIVGDGSSLLETDGELLWREERWVLGYTTTGEYEIDQVFVAEVRGVTDTRVRKLILGDIVYLASGTTPPDSGFVSDDEDTLPGFDDDADEEADEGDSGVA